LPEPSQIELTGASRYSPPQHRFFYVAGASQALHRLVDHRRRALAHPVFADGGRDARECSFPLVGRGIVELRKKKARLEVRQLETMTSRERGDQAPSWGDFKPRSVLPAGATRLLGGSFPRLRAAMFTARKRVDREHPPAVTSREQLLEFGQRFQILPAAGGALALDRLL